MKTFTKSQKSIFSFFFFSWGDSRWLAYSLSLLIFFAFGQARAQAPGGVSANLRLWLKADAGVTTATGVSQWNDQSGNGLNATQVTGANQPTFSANSLNFNPTLQFNGTSHRLATGNTSLFSANNSPVSFFTVFNTTNNSGQKFLVNQRFNNNCVTNIQLGYSTGFGGIGNYGLHTGCGNAAVTAAGTIQNNTYNLMSTLILNTGSSPSNINTFRNGLSLSVSNDGSGYTPAGSYETSSQNVPIDIGVRNDAFGGSSFNGFHAGNIGEIIIYTSTPTATQRRQIESYLALKYGLTINQTTATDYLASNGTTEMWDKDLAGASTYRNNIAGIGRDDASALNQKQSKSINANTPLTIGLGTVATTNALNTNTFANDRRFLTWADNNTALASVSTTDVPNASFPRRMARIWQAQEPNGDVGNTQVVLDITGTGLTGLSANNFVILLDNDVTFANGISNSIVATSLVGSIVTFNNVNLTNGQYFTFANYIGSATSGVRGNMMIFNETPSKYIEVPHNASLNISTNQLTISAWVKRSSTGTYDNIVMKGSYGYGLIIDDNNRLGYWSEFDYTNCFNSGTNTIPANTWTHVAAVVTVGSSVTLYINGINVGTSANPAHTVINNNTDGLGIGVQDIVGGGYNNLDGNIDEVQIWNTARTQAQIRESMHLTLSGIESGLVAYYQFNETSGNAIDVVSGNNGTLLGGASRTISTVSVAKGISNRQTVNATGNYDFTGTNCSLNFSSVGTPGEIVVNRLEGAPYGTQLTGAFSVYARYYWVINNYSITGFSATPTFVLGSNQVSTGDQSVPTNLKLNKRDTNIGSGWTQINGTSANASTGSITFGAITSFSEFGITSDGSSPLPITLIQFNASRINADEVQLAWATATELNNKGFEIEMSENAQNFQKIAFVDGIGNSVSIRNYQVRVNNSKEGYYRLKQVDFDGKYSYSPIRYVGAGDVASDLLVWPNPSTDRVQLKFERGGLNENLHLTLYDSKGLLLWEGKGNLMDLENKLNEKLKAQSNHFFILRLSAKSGVFQSKIIKF